VLIIFQSLFFASKFRLPEISTSHYYPGLIRHSILMARQYVMTVP
jgi:hypothetical protein